MQVRSRRFELTRTHVHRLEQHANRARQVLVCVVARFDGERSGRPARNTLPRSPTRHVSQHVSERFASHGDCPTRAPLAVWEYKCLCASAARAAPLPKSRCIPRLPRPATAVDQIVLHPEHADADFQPTSCRTRAVDAARPIRSAACFVVHSP
ncbi:hypothetical protein EXIGLDRAFT_389240 [Exidia glandulosa HHB12029]|uniref:Uncharacterized protein n=1 Tax=Exidia glandulosa HHB12029 TaxID=1314781 RepID=A0A165BTM6_EXIGL|nr:hypothetical protein EXIGLDRAFT_389240 [Exidia glandulosa HHB12029]